MNTQNLSEDMIITLIVVGLIALMVGFFIGRVFSGRNNAANKQTEAALKEAEAAQKALADYKETVSTHFGKTADLVDNLTQSYKDVYEHLGNSAKSLLTDAQMQQHLASRASSAVTLSYIDNATETSETTNTEKGQVMNTPNTTAEPSAGASKATKNTEIQSAHAVDQTAPEGKTNAQSVADNVSEKATNKDNV